MENINKLKKEAEKIIKELITFDPSLKALENDLNVLALSLIKNKPKANIDPDFQKSLKLEILKKVEELKVEGQSKALPFSFNIFFKKMSFSLGVLALTIIIVLPLTRQLAYKIKGPSNDFKVAKLEDNAFGQIHNFDSTIQENNNLRGTKVNLLHKEVLTTGVATLIDYNLKTISDNLIVNNFNDTGFNYHYEGDSLEAILSDLEEVYVYRKDLNTNNNSVILKSLLNSNNGLFNLKKIKQQDSKLKSFSLEGGKDFPYILDFNDNTINLHPNWKYWPDVSNDFNYDDLLSDEEVVRIAKDFMKKYGINSSTYGQVEIVNNFHEIYKKSLDKTSLYVPDETELVFPFLIDNKEVKNEAGKAYGLTITVNSSYKKVTMLTNLTANNYEASAYKTFTDVEKIKKILENGGLDNQLNTLNSGKVIDVKLGTPDLIVSRQKHYDNENYSSFEIFVPSLSFPVIELSEESDYITESNIVIPLLKSIIDYSSIDLSRPIIMSEDSE